MVIRLCLFGIEVVSLDILGTGDLELVTTDVETELADNRMPIGFGLPPADPDDEDA